MAINTDIWGAPEDWGLHNEFFGVGRSPTSTADEEKYPQFYAGLNGNGILYSYAEEAEYSAYFEDPTGSYDPSCAYIGIQGDHLPQYNIKVYVFDEDAAVPKEYASLKKTGDTIPFTFASCWFDRSTFNSYTPYIASYLTGFDGYRLNNATIKTQQKTFRYSPDAPAHPYSSSFNQVTAPMLNFGTKSVILIPYVTVSADGQPYNTTTYSLKQFSELTQTQINELYIVRVYCRTYVRTGIGKYAHDINNKNYMYPQFIGDWEFKDFNVDGFSDNLAFARGGANGNCELIVFGGVVETNYFPRISTGNYDQAVWASHACIVLINDQWEAKQINEGTYKACIYGNLKKEGSNYLKDNIIEMIRTAVAAYGLFWIEDNTDIDLNNVSDSDFFSDKMYVGLIDDDGLTRGRYSHGLQNLFSNNFNWTDVRQSTYDPYIPHPLTPENDYSYSTQSHSIGDLATLTKRYIIDAANVEQLGTELWNISGDIAQDDPSDPYKNYDAMVLDTFLTNDPIDCIISLRRFPMSIPHAAENLEHVLLGKVSTDVEGYPMNRAAYEYSFERIRIYPKFAGSFLDYEPYTQFELFIPFCGTVKLSPADILGRELWCKLIVDFCTGTCIGYVYSDDLLIESVNGTLAIDIPVTGTETTSLKASLENAIASYDHSKIQARQTTLSIATIGGLFSTVINPAKTGAAIDEANYNSAKNRYALEHQIAPVHTIGSASPLGLWAVDLDCRLIIYYPTGKVIASTEPPDLDLSELNAFAEVQGLATIETGRIGDYSGFMQGTDALLTSITTNTQGYAATDMELQLIQNLINTGIIV